MRFYKPNACNMVLKLSRFTLKGHHPSYLLLIKIWLNTCGDSLCRILASWGYCPRVSPILWFHHSWTDIPGQPGVGLTPTKARIMQVQGGENYSITCWTPPERADCKGTQNRFQIGVVTVSPAVPIRIINIISNKGLIMGVSCKAL